MQENASIPVTDAFTMVDGEGSSPVPQWYTMLADKKHTRGCAEIHVQVWRGHQGFKTFAVQAQTTAEGGEVQAGDQPELDPTNTVMAAHNMCIRYARREGNDLFRLQIRVRKKNGAPLTDGEYATVRLDAKTGSVLGHHGHDDDDKRPSADKMMRDMWGWLDKLMTRNVETLDRAGQTMEKAIELGDRLEARRHAIEDRAAEIAQAEHPEEQTKQVLAGLQFAGAQMKTLITLYLLTTKGREAAETFSASMGSDTPSSHNGAPNQAEVQQWWRALSPEEHDAIRDELGGEGFDAIVEAIHAEAKHWPQCASALRDLVAKYSTQLAHALSEESFRGVCRILGVR